MTLHRRWFLDILEGTKTEEYREIKPYWAKRLLKTYDRIEFRNGYACDAPVMTIEYHGHEIKEILHPITNRIEVVFALKLGRILHTTNCEKLVSDKQLSMALETAH
jgi:hypothetical protein